MSAIHGLHSFLTPPTIWNCLETSLQTINIYDIACPQASFAEWATQFNGSLSPNHDNIALGYSLGGRLALHALIAQPHLWKAAVIVSTHPGLKNLDERKQRIQSDRVWADRFLHDPWADLMQDWNQQSVFKDSKSLDLKESDFTRQQLADALLGWSLGLQEDLQDSIEQLDIPLLWIAGAHDTKFTALSRSLKLRHPSSRIEVIPQAGHRVMWDAPNPFKHVFHQFIKDCYAYESHLARN